MVNFIYKKKNIQIIIYLLTLLLISTIGHTQNISLEKVIIDTTDKNMTIDATVNFLGMKRIVDFLTKDGVQILFYTDVKIEKEKKWFFNEVIFEKKITYILSFDPIKNEYIAKGQRKIVAKSLDEILDKIKTIRINISLWNKGENVQHYNLIVYSTFKKKVPYWIEKTLFFWNFQITPEMEQSITFSF